MCCSWDSSSRPRISLHHRNDELTNSVPVFTAGTRGGYLSTHSAPGEIWERKKGIYDKILCPGASLVSPGKPWCRSPEEEAELGQEPGWKDRREQQAHSASPPGVPSPAGTKGRSVRGGDRIAREPGKSLRNRTLMSSFQMDVTVWTPETINSLSASGVFHSQQFHGEFEGDYIFMASHLKDF